MNKNSNEWMDDSGPEGVFPEGGRSGPTIMRKLLGQWYWLVFGLIVGLAAADYYLTKALPEYTAFATLMVKQQTSGVLSKDQPEEIDMRSIEAMSTVAERLKRQNLLERVALRRDVREAVGLMPMQVRWLPRWLELWLGRTDDAVSGQAAGPATQQIVAMIAGRMSVSIRRGTRLLDIKITHPSPEIAATIANAVADEYIKEVSQGKVNGRSNSLEILSVKSEESRVSLQNGQRALASYVRALASNEQLEAKEKEMIELRRRYLPKHPKMIGCSGQVESMQKRFLEDFDSAVSGGADQSYWKETTLMKNGGGQSQAERLNQARQALLARTAVLKSEIQSQELVFNAILTKMGETDVNQGGGGDSEIDLSSSAMVPGQPVSPVPTKVWLLGILGGGLCGTGLAYLFAKIDNKFHTVLDIETETGVPTLGAISKLPLTDLMDSIQRSNRQKPAHEEGWREPIVFRTELFSTNVAEMFRVLRASVMLLGSEEKRKITMFTSAIPGEGKTLVAGNFALAAAAQGRKVLLIDLDLRKPSVHKLFGLEDRDHAKGVSGVLAGSCRFEDALVSGIAPNLDLMSGGSRGLNSGELMGGGALEELLARACVEYDLVVADTSPLLAVPDSRLIARFVQNICLVVRADYVPRDAVRRALDLLKAGRTPASGIVVNGFREKRRLIASNYTYGYYRVGARGSLRTYGYGSYGCEDP